MANDANKRARIGEGKAGWMIEEDPGIAILNCHRQKFYCEGRSLVRGLRGGHGVLGVLASRQERPLIKNFRGRLLEFLLQVSRD